MMKTKDVKAATALIIGGYLRAADEIIPEGDNVGQRDSVANDELAKCIAAIRQECKDWEENLEGDDAALAKARALR